MFTDRKRWLPPIVLALMLIETPAASQSAASHVAAMGLLDGCRAATIPNVNVIFLGRPFVAGNANGSRRIPMHVEYVTLMGIVVAGSRPDGATSVPLNGLRIRVLSEGFVMDVFTQPDGTFSATGIPPGRLELTPFLPATLKVLDPRTLTYTASADECVLEMISVVSSGRTRQ